MSQPLSLIATQTSSVIVAIIAAQTSQTVSATHSQVTGESSQAMMSTLALVLPIAPPQTSTGDTLPSLVASSDPPQQEVPVSQPPPLVTTEALAVVPMIVLVAPTTIAAPIQTVLATESVGQPEGETTQALTTLSSRSLHVLWHLALLILPHLRARGRDSSEL